jgi:hypothetical protein
MRPKSHEAWGIHPIANADIEPILKTSGSSSLMKTQNTISRTIRGTTLTALLISIFAGVGCMTTYDSAGRPVQSVDPGAAVAGAAAAGILGYAIGSNNNNDHHHNYRNGRYYGSRSYYRAGPRGYYYR